MSLVIFNVGGFVIALQDSDAAHKQLRTLLNYISSSDGLYHFK